MSESYNTVSLSILGKLYKVKCPTEKIQELRDSAQYLEERMRKLGQSSKITNTDRLAIITALNVTHELLIQKMQTSNYIEAMNQRIYDLQQKIALALANPSHEEL